MGEKIQANSVINTGGAPVCFITGATATGKTVLAAELAKRVGGEVISADSMQIYRGMDIGTAKPTIAERGGIPHHMIDIAEPDEAFSVADFQARAMSAAADIAKRGKIPIVAGGTGLYINSLLYYNDYNFAETAVDSEYRQSLYTMAENEGVESVHALLAAADPDRAGAIHPRNLRRVVRSLEYIRQTGEKFPPVGDLRKTILIDGKIFILYLPRDRLYAKIESRIDNMLTNGLVEEVDGLLAKGFGEGLASMRGLGYKECAAYLRGRVTYEEFVQTLKTNTRHFAKRQLTWFRHQCHGTELNAEDVSVSDILAIVGKGS